MTESASKQCMTDSWLVIVFCVNFYLECIVLQTEINFNCTFHETQHWSLDFSCKSLIINLNFNKPSCGITCSQTWRSRTQPHCMWVLFYVVALHQLSLQCRKNNIKPATQSLILYNSHHHWQRLQECEVTGNDCVPAGFDGVKITTCVLCITREIKLLQPVQQVQLCCSTDKWK